MILPALFLFLVFVHGLFSRRIAGSILTEPILFTAAGMASAWFLPLSMEGAFERQTFLHVAELGLVLLLFTDASRTDLKALKSIRNLPERLLSGGLLLSIGLGALLAMVALPGLSLWEGAILGAILAPTDAGLGQVIVNSSRVPLKIREALDVESGLNDGLSVPFLLFFIALAAAGGGPAEASLIRFVGEQLGLGVLVGGILGLAGGWILGLADRKGWTDSSWQQFSVMALPLLCLVLAGIVSASAFIAAFVAGLAVQKGFPEVKRHSTAFAEEWGHLLNLSIFFLFGNIAASSWHALEAPHWIYAILSLTVIRMVPVAAALLGSRLSAPTMLFIGWFGPRGLASIVLGLVFLERELHLPGESAIRLAITATVLLSIFAHGLTAKPGIALYEKFLRHLPPDAPEREDPLQRKAPGDGK